jgi:protein disulfide-isomerase
MKFIRLPFVPLLLACALLQTNARAAVEWLTELPRAQAQARTEGKTVFIHFSGSDWCGWCIKLRKEVFLKPEFESYAKSNLVLVRIDFPRRTNQPPAIQRSNQKLAEQFQVQGYPTLVLLDSQGTNLGTVSYGHGGAKQFLADVDKIIRPPLELAPRLPAKRAAETRRASKDAGKPESPGAELTLRRITGSKHRRQVVINDRTFTVGQTATVKVATGRVKVRCVEIREKSVVVSVDGEAERRELTLGPGA